MGVRLTTAAVKQQQWHDASNNSSTRPATHNVPGSTAPMNCAELHVLCSCRTLCWCSGTQPVGSQHAHCSARMQLE
jgi:hypothetical protein